MVTFNRKDAPERQIPIPSRVHARRRRADPHRHDLHRRLAVIRANLLFEVEPNEAKTLVSKGWRFWLRRAQMTGDIQLLLEA